MVPNGTAYDSFPSFADSGTRVQPSPASKYAQGFLPGETYPAEWQNWFMHGSTSGITRLNTDTLSIKKEINTVLAEKGIQNNADSYTQLLQALNVFKAEAILAAHPVGSLYWTSSDENPAVTFGGGTWTQIKDKFIWAKGDSDTVNATGGAKTVTITSANLPTHTHTFEHTHEYTPSGSVNKGGSHYHAVGHANVGPGTGYDSSLNNILFSDTVKNVETNDPNSDNTIGARTTSYMPITSSSARIRQVIDSEGDGFGWIGSGTYIKPRVAPTTWGGYHKHTFTGTKSSTTSQSTSTTGDGGFANNAVNIMNPYIVKYCWERTA